MHCILTSYIKISPKVTGSFGLSENTSFTNEPRDVWTYGTEENKGVSTFDPNDSVWTYGTEENKGVSTFDPNDSVWTIGSFELGSMSNSEETIVDSNIPSIQEDLKEIEKIGKHCVQTKLGLNCN